MHCSYRPVRGGVACWRCGHKRRGPAIRDCDYTPATMGLGDWVAAAIVVVLGIAKDSPKCGCAKRRQALNAFGHWLYVATWRGLWNDRKCQKV